MNFLAQRFFSIPFCDVFYKKLEGCVVGHQSPIPILPPTQSSLSAEPLVSACLRSEPAFPLKGRKEFY